MATVKEVKLMKDGAMVTPLTLIDSLRNLDGTKYKDTVTNLLATKAPVPTYYEKHYTVSALNGGGDRITVPLPSLQVGQMCFISLTADNVGGLDTQALKAILPSGGTYMILRHERSYNTEFEGPVAGGNYFNDEYPAKGFVIRVS